MKKFFVLLFILAVVGNLYGQSRDYTSWWMEKFGDYAGTDGKADPRVQRASGVFHRLVNAADKSVTPRPRFFIIKSTNGPYAQAIPDGGIIINPKTLDICYNGKNKIEGDRRMGFVIGHELAHLANKDFMHRKAFLALARYGAKKIRKQLREDFRETGNRTKELMADKRGALFAAMAGFDIGKLFGERDNFLEDWARQTGIGYAYDNAVRHPSFKKRAEFLRPQLLAVAGRVELFRAGVLLLQMENYHDAAAAFLEFSKAYPAREVYNNIGACYFNLAMRHLHLKYSDDYYRFRLSTVIDYSTSAQKITPRGDGNYLRDKDIAGYLAKAVDYFQRAGARDPHDPFCRYNLAAALILNKEYAAAQAVCDTLLKKDPRDVHALNNKAVAFYFYGQEADLDTTQNAIDLLEKAHKLKPNHFETFYNLAALKEERMRLAGARVYWEKYLNLPATPRDNFYRFVYKKLKGTELSKSMETVDAPVLPEGIRLGENISDLEAKYLVEYRVGIEENNGDNGWSIALQVMVKGGVRVLALDGTVEIVEQKLALETKPAEILKKFGPPRKMVRHAGGSFYVYNGFSFKEVAGKIRSLIHFEKEF